TTWAVAAPPLWAARSCSKPCVGLGPEVAACEAAARWASAAPADCWAGRGAAAAVAAAGGSTRCGRVAMGAPAGGAGGGAWGFGAGGPSDERLPNMDYLRLS